MSGKLSCILGLPIIRSSDARNMEIYEQYQRQSLKKKYHANGLNKNGGRHSEAELVSARDIKNGLLVDWFNILTIANELVSIDSTLKAIRVSIKNDDIT